MSGDPSPLRLDTTLRRRPHLRFRIGPDGIVYAIRHGGEVSCGPRGLAILDAFAEPRSIADALDGLDDRLPGTQAWMDATSAIMAMIEGGVLVDASVEHAAASADGSFADPVTHAMMLNDRGRTAAFVDAIGRVVRPGDVVLDIGTGTGVLAMAAARAGARQVYAVEATGIGRIAREIAAVNDLADRVTVVDGWSTDVEIPERADVLVSEIIGEVPLDERLLESTLDARSRHLVPEPRVIPERLRIVGTPVAIPSDLLRTRVIDDDTIADWRSWYGADFEPLRRASQGLTHLLFVDGRTAADLPTLGPALTLAELDLASFDRIQVSTETEGRAERAGGMNGIVMSFEADLAPGVTLSTDPIASTSASSWRNAIWFFDRAIEMQPGDAYAVRLSYRAPGQRNGVTVERR